MWKPISLREINYLLDAFESKGDSNLVNHWNQIKITPEKWDGTEGNKFWAVAIDNKNVIWYNDIEEGFNISLLSVKGKIIQYNCDQDDLNHAIIKLIQNKD